MSEREMGLVNWMRRLVAGAPAEQKDPLQEEFIDKGRCPFCHHTDDFIGGPEGGLCVNLWCGNCGARFNLHRIPGAPRVEVTGQPRPKAEWEDAT